MYMPVGLDAGTYETKSELILYGSCESYVAALYYRNKTFDSKPFNTIHHPMHMLVIPSMSVLDQSGPSGEYNTKKTYYVAKPINV